MGSLNVVPAAYVNLGVLALGWDLQPSFQGSVSAACLPLARQTCRTNLALCWKVCEGSTAEERRGWLPRALWLDGLAGHLLRRGGYLWCLKNSAALAKREMGLLCKAELLWV